MPGFVSANYKQAGKILLACGLVCLIVKLFSYLTGWFSVSNYLACFGTSLMLVGLYLIFILPKE